MKSLADVINGSGLLEKRGIAIVPSQTSPSTINYIFLDKIKYEDDEDKNALGYVTELVALIQRLIHKHLIIPIPFHDNEELVKYPEIWEKIHEKLADFGFILRYPEGKEDITGFSYEPWHIRYIDNVETAKKIMVQGLTFEGYLLKN